MAEEELEEILDLHQEGLGTAEKIRKSRGFKIFIIILLAILVSVILWIIFGGKSEKKWQTATSTSEVSEDGKKTIPAWPTFPLKTLSFFIKDKAEEKSFFVKMQLTLAYTGKEKIFLAELEQREYEITDLILTLFSKKYFEDINTPEKRDLIKKELRDALNEVMIHGHIEEVFISEYNILLN